MTSAGVFPAYFWGPVAAGFGLFVFLSWVGWMNLVENLEPLLAIPRTAKAAQQEKRIFVLTRLTALALFGVVCALCPAASFGPFLALTAAAALYGLASIASRRIFHAQFQQVHFKSGNPDDGINLGAAADYQGGGGRE